MKVAIFSGLTTRRKKMKMEELRREIEDLNAKVELAHGGRGSSYDSYSSYNRGGSHDGLSRWCVYRVLVIGLAFCCSMARLKDHLPQARDVLFSQVYHDRDGIWSHF